MSFQLRVLHQIQDSPQHWRCIVCVQLLWDREHPVRVGPDVRSPAALRDNTAVFLRPLRAPSVNHHDWAVVLVFMLALLALPTAEALSANAHPVAHFDVFDAIADLDCLANDLVADGQRIRHGTPSAGDGVEVRSADTAGINLDVNVIVAEILQLEGTLVEITVGLSTVDLEANGLFRVRHDDERMCVVRSE